MQTASFEGITFKWYEPRRSSLSSCRLNLRELPSRLAFDLSHMDVIKEPRSQADADKRGVTYWVDYDLATRECTIHRSWSQHIKTEEGWMQYCCAKAKKLDRLTNTHVPLTEVQINANYEERRMELETMICVLQKAQTARSVATRKANKLVEGLGVNFRG